MTAARDLWTLPIDWSRGFEEEIVWRTNVITSRNGREQRIALRAKPRVAYTFTSFLARGGLEAAILRVAEQQGRTLYLPYPRDHGQIGVPSGEGALAINLLSAPAWLAGASFAAVINVETGAIEMVEIASVSGLTATLREPLRHPALTRSKVMQVREGRLADDIDIRAGTNRVGTVEVVFDADPVATPFPDYGDAPEIFNGVELFELQPNWAGGVQHGFQQDRLDIDLTKGAVDAAFPVAFTTRSVQLRFLLRNDDQISRLLGLFSRSRGRQKSFYTPLWLSEFRPISDIADFTSNVTFEGRDLFDAYAESTVHRTIAIRAIGNGFIRRGVTSLSLDNDDNTVFHLASPLPAIDRADLAWAGWLGRARFSSDRLTINWLTDSVAEATVTMTVLEQA
ncbi:MAG: hypothetical protein ACR2RE_03905 [Geminicoccaceae bacterium]